MRRPFTTSAICVAALLSASAGYVHAHIPEECKALTQEFLDASNASSPVMDEAIVAHGRLFATGEISATGGSTSELIKVVKLWLAAVLALGDESEAAYAAIRCIHES